MNFKLERQKGDEVSTPGILVQVMDDGAHFPLCATLEDAFHPEKIPGETRIPAGKYKLVRRTFAGFHERYSKRFAPLSILGKPWHQGMIQLADVPNYDGILVHIGNSHKDTRGCILIGRRILPPDQSPNGHFYLIESTKAYQDVYPKLRDAVLAGNATIEIVDELKG